MTRLHVIHTPVSHLTYKHYVALAQYNGTTVEEEAGVALDQIARSTTADLADEATGPSAALKTKFDVAANFPDYPTFSKSAAQQLVQEAESLLGVTAYKKGLGISFRPTGVVIDYLISCRGGKKPGIVVSWYGGPDTFSDPLKRLAPGRKSYMTARIESQADLEYFLPCLRESYERRYGAIGEVAQ